MMNSPVCVLTGSAAAATTGSAAGVGVATTLVAPASPVTIPRFFRRASKAGGSGISAFWGNKIERLSTASVVDISVRLGGCAATVRPLVKMLDVIGSTPPLLTPL